MRSANTETWYRPAVTEVLLHIGLQKTGTTSLQEWASANSESLSAQCGIDVYRGFIPGWETNHFELPMLSQRPERPLWVLDHFPESRGDQWQRDARAHIRNQVDSGARSLLISSEGMANLRFDDEVERIAELLAPHKIRVVVTLREPVEWLKSYKLQMLKTQMAPSDDPTSCAYIEPDTWLLDFDGLVTTWRRVLGDKNVIVLSYEKAQSECGSTIPAIMRAFGVDPAALPDGWDLRVNVTPIPPRFLRLRKLIRRVIPRSPGPAAQQQEPDHAPEL